ncbi:MAG: trehalase family glycosidase [Candidatus Thermoplasmatota archaeon]|nr:trehalase family glycosidase [Candidatus Thermoplasmatota archaeon]
MQKIALFLALIILPWSLNEVHSEGVYFDGAPLYAESLTTGGSISDFGSHFGIKANVSESKFMKLAHYSCLAANNGMFSHTWIEVNGDNPDIREITFHPFYIEERATFKDISANARAYFIDTDALLIEGQLSDRAEIKIRNDFENATSREFMVQDCDIEAHNTLLLDSIKIIPPPVRGELSSTALGETTEIYRCTSFPLPGNTRDFFIVIGYGTSRNEAMKNFLDGHYSVLRDGTPFDRINKEWNEFLEGVNSKSKEHEALVDLALTALRMGAYAPRNRMSLHCSVPSKVHFNFFWGWDTAFQALGANFFNSTLAMEYLYTQFEGMKDNGMLCHMIDDSLAPVSNITQPPVQFYAIDAIYEKTQNKTFLEDMYERSESYIEWFFEDRDTNGNGLLEYLAPDESGWDDSPRFVIGDPGYIGSVRVCVDAVDLNVIVSEYMRYLSLWARELGYVDESESWGEKSKELSARIDELMWNESAKAWFDLDRNKQINILTPTIWYPCFTTENETRAREVIEKHLLNEKEFFGEYPVPTVAYNSEYYNHDHGGHYWRGQIWLVTSYSALKALEHWEYENEAKELMERTLDMMEGKGGIYENYDALTGGVGWGSNGIDDPACFQFGWSSTFVLKMLCE